jgi:hypothetical protein
MSKYYDIVWKHKFEVNVKDHRKRNAKKSQFLKKKIYSIFCQAFINIDFTKDGLLQRTGAKIGLSDTNGCEVLLYFDIIHSYISSSILICQSV